MPKDHVLAIECGTQSTRALLFDLRGTLVHRVREICDGLYRRVCRLMVRRLRPLCPEIWRIAGYPPRQGAAALHVHRTLSGSSMEEG